MASYVTNLGAVDLTKEVYSAATGAVPQFPLGTKAVCQDGKIFRYCKAQAAKTIGHVYIVTYAWEVTDGLTTTTDDAAPVFLCVPAETKTAPSGQTYAYAWYQTGGNFDAVELLVSCNPDVELMSSATSGHLDDSGGKVVQALKGVGFAGDHLDSGGATEACFSHCEIFLPTDA